MTELVSSLKETQKDKVRWGEISTELAMVYKASLNSTYNPLNVQIANLKANLIFLG